MTPSRRTIALCASYAPSFVNFRGDLVEKLRAAGCDVLCVAPEFNSEVKDWLSARGARMRCYPLNGQGMNPISDLKALRCLVRIFKEEKVDTAMGYTTKPAIYAAYAGALAGIARNVPMVTGLGYGFYPEDWLRKLYVPAITRMLFRTSLRRAHGVVFHNKDNLAMFRAERLIPKETPAWVVGGSGVNTTRFACQELPVVPTSGALKFLLIGRLVKYKGILEYAQAAQQVKAVFPQAEFHLVGGGDDNPLGLTPADMDLVRDVLIYHGPSNDVRAHLADCHVFALPSYGEGMPRTVLEALSVGRAIITTDVYGCRDTVEEGQNGYLVPAKEVEGLAQAMLSFLRAPETLVPMAAASRRIAEERFDTARVNQTMCEALGVALPNGSADMAGAEG